LDEFIADLLKSYAEPSDEHNIILISYDVVTKEYVNSTPIMSYPQNLHHEMKILYDYELYNRQFSKYLLDLPYDKDKRHHNCEIWIVNNDVTNLSYDNVSLIGYSITE